MYDFNTYKYPFITESSRLLSRLLSNIYTYDSTSCQTIFKLLSVGMKTCDLLLSGDSTLTVDDMIALNRLWQAFWDGSIAFFRVASVTNGTEVISISSASRALLNTFYSWDSEFQPRPFQDITDTFTTIILGVSA